MQEVRGSIWINYPVPGHAIRITTNGVANRNGEVVMGRGVAQQATELIDGIAKDLGSYIKEHGNQAGYLYSGREELIVFPTKHKWWERTDPGLIAKSANWLLGRAVARPDIIYHVPRPGCGNRGRDWEREVKRIVSAVIISLRQSSAAESGSQSRAPSVCISAAHGLSRFSCAIG